jgi:hypothetical protein
MDSPLAELDSTVHREKSSELHVGKGVPSKIDRKQFKKEKEAYWKARASEIREGMN